MADLARGEGDLVVLAAGGDAAHALAGAARGVIVLLVTPPGPVPPLYKYSTFIWIQRGVGARWRVIIRLVHFIVLIYFEARLFRSCYSHEDCRLPGPPRGGGN